MIPNIVGSFYLPKELSTLKENKYYVALERVGQVGSVICLVIFKDFNLMAFSMWSIWIIISFGCLVLYEVSWIRYLKSNHNMSNFYRSLMGIPMPMVILPIISFVLLGIYGKVAWLILFAVLFGIGHIKIHSQHWMKHVESK